jgi:hypothetical protein
MIKIYLTERLYEHGKRIYTCLYCIYISDFNCQKFTLKQELQKKGERNRALMQIF